MALSNNNGGQTGTLLILKPVSKVNDEKVRPFFEISRSENGKWVADEDQSINSITATLVKIEPHKEEYKGDEYYRVRIYLKDGDETYLVPCRMNIATRSLFNSLLNLQTFENVSIRYYLTKSGYDAFYVSQDGEKVTWKYENDEVPVATEVSYKGKTIRDFTNVDLFFVEKLTEFNDILSGKASKAVSSKETEPVKTAKKASKKKVEVEEEESVVEF